jgi:uncharacterized protein (DUF2062 family)
VKLAPLNPLGSWRSRWRELLRDPVEPRRTAAAFGLGVWVGTTPILGVHTWLAFGLASLFRLPALASLLASNVSNPLTFIPITLLEVRLGSWLLGREFRALPTAFSPAELGGYWLEAWLGWALLGISGAALAYLLVLRALRARRALDALRWHT